MKFFKFLALLLGVGLIAAPVILVFGFIKDDTTVEVERAPFGDVETFANKKIHYSIENTQTTSKVNLSITQDELNGFIQYIQDTYVPDVAKDYVKQGYILIDGTNYNFYIEVTTPIFNTRVVLETTLDYKEVDDDNAFFFKINKFGVGKLLGDGTFSTSIGKMFIKSEDINKGAADAGFHINVDLENLSITYKMSDLYNDVKTKMKTDNSSLILDIADLIISEKLVGFNFDSSIQVDLNANKFHSNPQLAYPAYDKDLHLTQHCDQIDTLLNANIITKDDIQDVYLYLVNGYEPIEERIQDKVRPLNLTSIGITDNEAYDGEHLAQAEAFDSLILDQVEITDLMTTGHVANVKEQELSQKLCANGLLGTGYFTTIEEDGVKKTNYVALSDLYTNIYDNKLVLTASLSINGYMTQLYVETTALQPQAYSLPLRFDTLAFGEITPSESLTNFLFTFLENVSANFDWFSCRASDKSMSLEFLPIIEESSYKDLIKTAVSTYGGNLKIALHGADLADENGYLELGIPTA